MNRLTLLGWAVGIAASGLISSAESVQAAQCKTWKSFVNKLPETGGRGGQWWHHGDLPSKFQNGCMELSDNNSTDTAYVFQQGIQSKDYKNWDQLVQQGKAIVVTWLTPTNGAIPYLKSIPTDRAFLRKDGMTCFLTVCLKSGTMSHEQLGKILTYRKQLQDLPDGTHFYGKSPDPDTSGTEYIIFRKTGKLAVGTAYKTNTDGGGCFFGMIERNAVSLKLSAHIQPMRPEPQISYERIDRIMDVTPYYKISSDQIPEYAKNVPQFCTNLMAKAPADLIDNLPANQGRTNTTKQPDPIVKSPLSPISPRGSIASAHPPSPQEIARITQQNRSLQGVTKLSQSQLNDRQKLRNQTSKYLAPFVGGWLTANNQRIFVYPSSRKDRQACIIVEKDGAQELQIGVANGNAVGTDINIGDIRLFNTKQETLGLRQPGSDQLIAVYPSPDLANLTADHRSAMEGNGCITSFPSTSIATAPTKPAFQASKQFSSIKAFGLDQFVRGDQTLAKVPLDLETAKQGQYALPKIPELDLMTEKLTDVPEKSGAFLGSRKDITLKDYLTLKLKVHQQGLLLGRTAQALGTAEKYLEQFPKDGQNRQPLVNNISAQFWQAVDQDSGSKRGLGDRLVYAIEEGRVSTGDFIKGTASTGFSAFTAWRDLGEWIDLLPNGSSKKRLQGLDTIVDGQKYLSSVNSNLSAILEASKSGDIGKANRELANLAEATVKWVDAIPEIKGQSKAIGRGKLLLEIRSNALKLEDATDLLKAPSTKEALDGFDRVYLTAASIDSAVELVSTVISALAPDKLGKSTLFGKAKAFKIIVIDSIKFTYQDDIRRQYQALQGQDKVNQKKINGLSAAFDFSGEEIGKYLLKNRADVLRQTRNGVVEVSTKETVYPRN
jgi:hypothetical protein